MTEPEAPAGVPAHVDGEPFSVTGREALGTLAIALAWVWFMLVMFSSAFLLPLPPTLHIEPLFRELCFVAMLLAFLAVLALGRRLRNARSFAIALVLAAVLSPWAMVCSVLAAPQPSLALEIVVWVAFGIAAAVLLCAEALFLKTLRARTTVLVLGVAVTVGACLYFMLTYTSPTVRLVAAVCLAPLAALCLWLTGVGRALGAASEQTAGRPWAQLRSSLRIQPAQPAYGVLFAMVLSIAISNSVLQDGQFPLGVAIGLCVAGPLAFAIALLPRKIDIGAIQWYLLPISVIGLLFTVFDNAQAVLACGALLALCYSFFDLMHTLSLIELMREQDDATLGTFAAGKVWFYLGVAVGWGLGELLLAVGYHGTAYRIVVLGVAAVVILAIAFIGRPASRHASGGNAVIVPPASVQERHEEACRQIAAEAGLSPRQTDVFLLLAKGRNAPYIEEELVVSYHTVKAHIYRIYQKLDVHTHQELIDLVEARING